MGTAPVGARQPRPGGVPWALRSTRSGWRCHAAVPAAPWVCSSRPPARPCPPPQTCPPCSAFRPALQGAGRPGPAGLLPCRPARRHCRLPAAARGAGRLHHPSAGHGQLCVRLPRLLPGCARQRGRLRGWRQLDAPVCAQLHAQPNAQAPVPSAAAFRCAPPPVAGPRLPAPSHTHHHSPSTPLQARSAWMPSRMPAWPGGQSSARSTSPTYCGTCPGWALWTSPSTWRLCPVCWGAGRGRWRTAAGCRGLIGVRLRILAAWVQSAPAGLATGAPLPGSGPVFPHLYCNPTPYGTAACSHHARHPAVRPRRVGRHCQGLQPLLLEPRVASNRRPCHCCRFRQRCWRRGGSRRGQHRERVNCHHAV